jgi:IclR family acetate operon transcriptional repressor
MVDPNPLPAARTLRRGLQLLQALIASDEVVPLPLAAHRLGIKTSTAYRLTSELQRAGLLTRSGRGRYAAGLALHRMACRSDLNALVSAVARPFLKALSETTGRVAHLGVFEDDMVTYLVREGPAEGDVFTREGMQLEAYCSSVGKVLLAELPAEQLDTYIATGTFVSLTSRTLIDRAELRKHLNAVRLQGYALDEEEIQVGLHCMAVPLLPADLNKCYAVSISGGRAESGEKAAVLIRLRETAISILGVLNSTPK